jgi:hypothetical protein
MFMTGVILFAVSLKHIRNNFRTRFRLYFKPVTSESGGVSCKECLLNIMLTTTV